jgi:hypothetical protein
VRTPGTSDGLTRAQAERVFRRLQDAEERAPRPVRGAIVPSVDEVCDSLRQKLRLRGARRSYLEGCESMQRVHISPRLGAKPVSEIRTAHIEALASSMLDARLAPKTVTFVGGEHSSDGKSELSTRRSVPMADRLARELDGWSRRTAYCGEDELVFAHPETGNPLDRSKVTKRFKAACKTAGVRAVRFHDLRHTFGTRLAATGQPIRSIQEFLGHARCEDHPDLHPLCALRARGGDGQRGLLAGRHGERNGEQTERNQAQLKGRNPCNGRGRRLSSTHSLGLGAGRSQVQILSPRFRKYLQTGTFRRAQAAARIAAGSKTGSDLF